MNVGFREAMKADDFSCVIFHDVDLIPEDARNDYGCPSSPRHMSTAVSRMNYKLVLLSMMLIVLLTYCGLFWRCLKLTLTIWWCTIFCGRLCGNLVLRQRRESLGMRLNFNIFPCSSEKRGFLYFMTTNTIITRKVLFESLDSVIKIFEYPDKT